MDQYTDIATEPDTESATPLTATTKASIPYSFIYTMPNERILEQLEMTDPEKLHQRLRSISFDHYDSSGKRADYQTIRKEVCAINLLLNHQGIIAPAFRNMRRPAKPSVRMDYQDEHVLVSNDRQMIDLHWIFLQRMNVERITGHANLFDHSKDFNPALAEHFVINAGRKDRKAKLLGLPEFDELQLCGIRSIETENRMKSIQSIYERNIRGVKDLINAPGCKYDSEMISNMPDIYKAILVARGVPRRAVQAYKFMTGKDLAEQNMRRVIKRLELFL